MRHNVGLLTFALLRDVEGIAAWPIMGLGTELSRTQHMEFRDVLGTLYLNSQVGFSFWKQTCENIATQLGLSITEVELKVVWNLARFEPCPWDALCSCYAPWLRINSAMVCLGFCWFE